MENGGVGGTGVGGADGTGVGAVGMVACGGTGAEIADGTGTDVAGNGACMDAVVFGALLNAVDAAVIDGFVDVDADGLFCWTGNGVVKSSKSIGGVKDVVFECVV